MSFTPISQSSQEWPGLVHILERISLGKENKSDLLGVGGGVVDSVLLVVSHPSDIWYKVI